MMREKAFLFTSLIEGFLLRNNAMMGAFILIISIDVP
jgi:hypothetical protein